MDKLIVTICIFSYLFLYGVKFLGIPLGSFMAGISILYLFKNKIFKKFTIIWGKELLILLFLLVYLLIIEFIEDVKFNNEKFSIYLVRIVIDGLLPAFIICDYFKKKLLQGRYFQEAIYKILILQIVVSFVMFFNQDIKSSIIQIMTNYDINNPGMLDHLYRDRGYGLGYSYLSWFPFSLSMLFIYLLYNNHFKSNFEISIFLLSTLFLNFVNARIGVVPLIFGLSIYFINRPRSSFFILLLILALAFLFFLVIPILPMDGMIIEKIEYFKRWVVDDGFASFFSEDGSRLVEDLSNFEILNEFSMLDFTFGRGKILTPDDKVYNDIGYIQILFNGGIVLSFFLYFQFYLFIYKVKNINYQKIDEDRLILILPTVYFIALLVGNLKLRIFEINEATRFLFLLACFYLAKDNYRQNIRVN